MGVAGLVGLHWVATRRQLQTYQEQRDPLGIEEAREEKAAEKNPCFGLHVHDPIPVLRELGIGGSKEPNPSKEVREYRRIAERQGWTVAKTRGGHLKFTSPTGRVVFTPSTPGGGRALANMRAELRRAGLVLKGAS